MDLPGYPLYPDSDDIYNRDKEETEINPEDIRSKKEINDIKGIYNEKDFAEDNSGNDLDIPGAELDDAMELVGSEDEENIYYSLGDDDNLDLEKEKNN